MTSPGMTGLRYFSLFLVAAAWPFVADAFNITNFSTGSVRTLEVEANTNSYYILYSGTVITNVAQPVSLSLGSTNLVALADSSPPGSERYYRVLEVPLTAPLDVDGDGIDDVFELRRAGCFNPLDPTDASADCDSDGRSNRMEYFQGTDPLLIDAAPNLVINEVDYDEVGTDTTEFVEILNKGTNTISLGFYALAFINGANNVEYLRVGLNGQINPGQYLVMASTNVTGIPVAARVLNFPGGENQIQNGAPDGIALINIGVTNVMDSLSYEGPMYAAMINGFAGTTDLVHGTALPMATADSNASPGSFSRIPDGAASSNDSADWAFTTTPTPGAANVP